MQNLQDEYLNNKNKLMAKKEMLWKQMDITKWDIAQGEILDNVEINIKKAKNYVFKAEKKINCAYKCQKCCNDMMCKCACCGACCAACTCCTCCTIM